MRLQPTSISLFAMKLKFAGYIGWKKKEKKILASSYPPLQIRLGRGSAYAILGKYEEGVNEFNAALEADPSVADAWKVRCCQAVMP